MIKANGREGFSVVEVLAAVVIVGILAVLVFPALEKAKDKAYSAGCISNLRHLMAAVHRYAADNNGYMPWIAASNGSIKEDGYAAGNGTDGHAVNVALGVGGYFDENPQILQCPGWRNWKKNSGVAHSGSRMVLPINNANGGANNSIRNTYEWRNLRPVEFNPPGPFWALVPKVKMAAINEPSKEWYIADHSPGKNYQPKVTTYSHGDGGYAAFVDGHVGWLTANPRQWTTGEPWINLPIENPGQFTRY